jgi:hypothetical protein
MPYAILATRRDGATGSTDDPAQLKARPSVRRRFDQAVLEAVYVTDRRIARAEFSKIFAPLFSPPVRMSGLEVVPTGFEPVSPP